MRVLRPWRSKAAHPKFSCRRHILPAGLISLLIYSAFPAYAAPSAAAPAETKSMAGRAWQQVDGSVQKSQRFLEDKLPLVENIGGYVQNRHYLRVHSMGKVDKDRELTGKRVEDTYEFRNDIRLETDLQVKDWATGRVSLDTQLDYGVDRDDFRPVQQSFKLFEGYGDFHYRQVDLRVGRQVIRWGKADNVNPIDNFTPQDFSEFLNHEREDRKLPVLAGYLKYFFKDSLHWEGIWIPFFQESIFAESEDDWELFFRRNYRKTLGFTFLPEKRPGRRLENSVWATRFVHEGSKADVSLNYAYHFEQNPTYEVHRDPLFPLGLSASPGTVDTVWTRQHTIGTDFEMARNDLGIRGEAAFMTDKPYVTYDLTDDDFVERKHTFQTVLGGDYTYKSNTYLNLQFTQDFILDHEEAMEARAYEYSVTFRLWRKFYHEKLKLQFQGRYFFSEFDFYYKADATYELTDDLEVNSGVMIFQGEDQDLFGLFAKNDQVFSCAGVSFALGSSFWPCRFSFWPHFKSALRIPSSPSFLPKTPT
jgi:hypothetical protein